MLLAGVEPGGGGVGLEDVHLDDEGLELELHDVVDMKIILDDRLRPVLAEGNVATKVGDLQDRKSVV